MKTKNNKKNSAFAKLKENPKLAASFLRTSMIIVAILMVLFVFASLLKQHFKKDTSPEINNKLDTQIVYSITSDKIIDIQPLNHGIVLLTQNELIFLDSSGSFLRKSDHVFDKPSITTSKTSVLLYEQGGTTYRIEKRSGIVYNGLTSKSIITASISNNGGYAFATKSEDATSQLIVYSKSFKEKFVWKCAAEHIVNIDLYSNNKYATIAVVGAKDAQIYTKVHVFDFNKSESLASFDFKNSSPFAVKHSKKNTALAYVSDGFHIINGANITKQSDFDLLKINYINFSQKNKSVIVASKFDSNLANEVYVFNAKGKSLASLEINENIKGLSCSNSAFSLILNNRIESYNYNGGLIGAYELRGDAIRTSSASGRLFILFPEGISVVKEDSFKKPNAE